MQQVIIVLADTTEQAEKNEEFIELVQAADMEIKETFTQNLKSITLRTYIGTGKCEEIHAYLQEQEIQRVVFNHDLSPLQIRNLEEILQTPVMDRTGQDRNPCCRSYRWSAIQMPEKVPS